METQTRSADIDQAPETTVEQPGTHRPRRRLSTLLSVGAIAFGSLGLAACGDEESAGPESAGGGAGGADVVEEEPAQGATAQPGEVTLTELLEEPERYVGQKVTVSGAVADASVDGEETALASFTLGEGVDKDLLVLPTSEGTLPSGGISDGDVLRVKGEVVRIDKGLEQEGDFRYEAGDDRFLMEFDNEVALAATSVETDVPRTDESEEQ